MNATLHFALELHRAKHLDLLRQAEEYRLGRAALSRAKSRRARPQPAASCCRPAAESA